MPEFDETPVGDPSAKCPTPEVVVPAPKHVFLAGQTFEAKTSPESATLTASGQKVEGHKLGIGAPGSTELVAHEGGAASEPVTCTIITAEVVEIKVLKTQKIDDAEPPEYKRPFGAEKWEHREVAAILAGEKLSIEVTLQAAEDLTAPAEVTLIGEADGVVLKLKTTLQKLSAGTKVTLESEKPLNAAVKVNKLLLRWRVESELSKAPLGGPDTELHVYTSFRPAIENVRGGRAKVRLKHHFEMACQWALGASKNIGNGADSIPFNIDNQMRHYVHTKDEKGDIWATCYPAGGAEPVNYADLPNAYNASRGDRGVSSLYYPPLEPKKDYEEYYPHYEHNFGWHLLDNATHTGGRCNQQASLVCDILGLLGIKATVHYLQRRGMGKKSGRPCRQYFYAAGGSGPWNFHGIVRVEIDGGEWLYDGSFSSPPRRLNGERAWAEKPGGPFIQKWHEPWTYEDANGWSAVPADDTPATWEGIQ